MTVHLFTPQTSIRYEVHTKEGCYFTDVEEQARRWGQRNHQTYITAITETRQKLPVSKPAKAASTKSAAIKAFAKKLNIPVIDTPLLAVDPASAAGYSKPARAAALPQRSVGSHKRRKGLPPQQETSPVSSDHEAPVLATSPSTQSKRGRTAR